MKLFPFSRFIVYEKSMEPNFRQGDHVLTFNWAKLKAGDVIVFKKHEKNYLKRINKLRGDKIIISGDNKNLSVKSISVRKEQITGRVLVKY